MPEKNQTSPLTGVLIIAHGSRAKETETVLEAVLSIVKEKLPKTIIDYAFMEFSDRTVLKGVSALAEKAVKEIKIVPYFLFSGIHIKEDIPNIVSQCKVKFPGVKITMGDSLGVDERLADIIIDRIRG